MGPKKKREKDELVGPEKKSRSFEETKCTRTILEQGKSYDLVCESASWRTSCGGTGMGTPLWK